MKRDKTIVGRVEKVDFPELGILDIEAKIDTGAYSTAIHSHRIWVEEKDGVEYLNFEVLDPSDEKYVGLVIRTKNFFRKVVKSSNGRKEKRYIIKTVIQLGGKKRKTDVSLTDRGKMKYPVLIGRKVLKNGFLVDVSQKNLVK
ncbi:MAG: ATP-dependent zinc protease [Bacteroidetes bacterium]|nr:MAG: ATP-dependent zinc protease [Bacteroidota bacterium]MBL1145119.1 ATP-dependent zinc protease [Bacteroidota bacterium]NOG57916.1 ATP-dependent zinc protease [Bacteroidota bacterium]